MDTQTVTEASVENDLRAADQPSADQPGADVSSADVSSVLRAQRRRRRARFWLGFAAILLVGGLWAGLTKDPARPALLGGINGGGAVDVAPAIAVDRPDFEVATTMVMGTTVETEPAPVPVPPDGGPFPTTVPPTVAPTTTAGP